MTNLFDLFDDDDMITLDRYQPMTNRGIDRILIRLKAMADHPATPATPTTGILAVQLPTHTIDFMASLHPDQYTEIGGHTGVVLNAVTRAAKGRP